MRARGTLALCAAALACAAPLQAQVRGVVTPTAPRGWIGFSYEVQEAKPGTSGRSGWAVAEVLDGSPAQRAGLLTGDLVLSINGLRVGPGANDAVQRLGLRPGDPVSLTVLRDGRRRTLELTAAPRPSESAVVPELTVVMRVDSVAEAMFRAMDSLRIRLVDEGPSRVRIVLPPGEASSSVSAAPRAFDEVGPPTVRAPFEFFVFRGEAHDSLRREMDELNREIRETRLRQMELTRTAAARPRDERVGQELDRLRSTLERQTREAETLKRTMADAARAAAQDRLRTAWLPGSRADVSVVEVPEEDESPHFRPLTPYLLGQNRAAGAEVVELVPELAGYFDVDAGVLVTEVPEGTPAHDAGIRPGDVLVRVGDREIRSIDDLRVGLGWGAEVRLEVVRRSERLEVTLRR